MPTARRTTPPDPDVTPTPDPEPAFVPAYDTRTGQKLPNEVPTSFFALFPYLKPTPQAAAAAAETTNPTPTED